MSHDLEREGLLKEGGERSVQFTLSIYLESAHWEKYPTSVRRAAAQLTSRANDPASLRIRRAIEPMMLDIADLEQLGTLRDLFLCAEEADAPEQLALQLPDEIAWQTEGISSYVRASGLSEPRPVVARRFWYLHRNGALSFHLSLSLRYNHTPADLFAISMLQKVVVPKEFVSTRSHFAEPAKATDETTGFQPLDCLRIEVPDGRSLTFWQFVRDRFDADIANLLSPVSSDSRRNLGAPTPCLDNLMEASPHVAGLLVPPARMMFYFTDRDFFDLLIPRDPASGKAFGREALVNDAVFGVVRDKLVDQTRMAPNGTPQVELDEHFWAWLLTDPALRKASEDGLRKGSHQDLVAYRDAAALKFLFLSGFNQNIIDFVNQDASEILDSTDPIYPLEGAGGQVFFVRFANPRTLITFVRNSRSLDAGLDYIGTCPYAFLIHVASLHNEYVTQTYEVEADVLTKRVNGLLDRRQFGKAADAFYAFHRDAHAAYKRDRYVNIFRYDTESEMFTALESVRGTSRRGDRVESMVGDMEGQTRDIEARTNRSNANLGLLLGALGIFGVFQLAFVWAEAIAGLENESTESADIRLTWMPPFLHLDQVVWTYPWSTVSAIALYSSIVVTVIVLPLVGWRLIRDLFR